MKFEILNHYNYIIKSNQSIEIYIYNVRKQVTASQSMNKETVRGGLYMICIIVCLGMFIFYSFNERVEQRVVIKLYTIYFYVALNNFKG